MSDFARRLLENAGAAPDPAAHDLVRLVDRIESKWFVDNLTGFRKFLKFSADPGLVRPSREFYESVFGHGREGCVALLSAYWDSMSDGESQAREQERQAIAAVARCAKVEGWIGWTLDTWRPAAIEPGKERLTAYLDAELAERCRVGAFNSRKSLSQFVGEAIAEKLRKPAAVEKRGGKRRSEKVRASA